MNRKEFEFDGEKYLEGEFVLLNGYVDVSMPNYKYDTKYVIDEQAFILDVKDNKAYLNSRNKYHFDQYLDDAYFVHPVCFTDYVVTEEVGKISKADICDNPPKEYVYLTEETEKYLKPNLTDEWIICIFLMIATAMFKPVFIWSLMILCGFLIYRYFRIKKYREEYKKRGT